MLDIIKSFWAWLQNETVNNDKARTGKKMQ